MTGKSFLTVDLGNSRCKLRLWHVGAERRAPVAQLDLDNGPQLATAVAAAIAPWLKSAVPLAGAALSSVAESSRTTLVVQALEQIFAERFLNAPDSGLINACRPPEGVGRDRLYAARGALALIGGPAVVVDAGTALTVDALAVEVSGRGVFAGGAIAAGPALLARAAAAGGALLPSFVPTPAANAVGRDTVEALQAGVAHGFRGAAAELVERVAEEAELGAAPVVLTGGAREFLLRPTSFTNRTVVIEENLVHLGLLAACAP